MFQLFLFLLLFGVLTIVLFHFINAQFTSKKKKDNKPSKMSLTEMYNDIFLEPVGCFSLLDEKFFAKKINEFSKGAVVDSGIIISENKADEDTANLINKIIENGFDQYGYYLINKYKSDYSKMDIIELGILGKLAGYSYISIYKLNEDRRGTVYFSYSPPLENNTSNEKTISDLPGYTLVPKVGNYTNEDIKEPGKELSCGYPCLKENKPVTLENGKKQYMCGSIGYPNIKTPTRFAVYHIAEH